jgi:plastocyanin
MRRLAILVCAGLTLALAAPAMGANQTVRATFSNTFSPSTVTIAVGDTVTWTNDGGQHNVKFDDGQFEQPSNPSFSWPSNPMRTFNAAGQYRYFCEEHGPAGSYGGMVGTVVVQQAGTQPPPGDTTAPDIDNLKVVPSTFCNSKTDRCPTRGTRIQFDIDEDAKIGGRIIRRKDGKRVGKVNLTANAGENDFAWSGKGLANGKYRLELTPKDALGNKATKPTRVSFKVASRR